MIKISIIVTTFNNQEKAQTTIDSFETIANLPIEVLLVDDGSNEMPKISFPNYLDYKIIRKENGGPLSARIEGIKKALGDFVYIIDSGDEILDKDFLNIFENLNDKTDVYFVGTLIKKGKMIDKLFDIEESRKISKNDIFVHLMKGEAGFSSSLIFKKSLFDNLFDFMATVPRIVFTEDQFLALNAVQNANTFAKINSYAYLYNKEPNSLSSSINQSKIDSYLYVFDFKYDLFSKYNGGLLKEKFLEIELFGVLKLYKSLLFSKENEKYFIKAAKKYDNFLNFCSDAIKYKKTLSIKYRILLAFFRIRIK